MGKPKRFGLSFAAAMDGLLLRNPDNLTGAVLRPAECEGLTRDEIYGLTWKQIDIEQGLVRLALDEEDLDKVKLKDLRNQYIFRQIEQCGWESATRTADISETTFRYNFSSGKNTESSPAGENASGKKREKETVLQRNRGAALFLARKCYDLGRTSAIYVLTASYTSSNGGLSTLPPKRNFS